MRRHRTLLGMQVGPPQFPPPPPPSWIPPAAARACPLAVAGGRGGADRRAGRSASPCRPVGGWLVEQVAAGARTGRPRWQSGRCGRATVVLVRVPVAAAGAAAPLGGVRATGRAWLAAVVALGAARRCSGRCRPVQHERTCWLTALARVCSPSPCGCDRRAVSARPPRHGPGSDRAVRHGYRRRSTTDAHQDRRRHGYGRRGGRERPARRTSWPAAVPAFAVGVRCCCRGPGWARWAGWLETVLAALAAAALGLLAGALLGAPFWAAFRVERGAGPADGAGRRSGRRGGVAAARGRHRPVRRPTAALLLTCPPAAFALAAL